MKKFLASGLLLLGLFSAGAEAAAPSFRASSGAACNSCTNDTAGLPTGSTDGDVIFLICGIESQDGTWSATGYTKIDEQSVGMTGGSKDIALFWQAHGGGSPGTTCSYSGTAADIHVLAVTYQDIDDTSPLGTAYSSGSHFAGSSVGDDDGCDEAAPAISTTDGDTVVSFHTCSATSDTTTPATGYTERVDRSQLWNYFVYDKTISSTGTETPGAVNTTAGGSAESAIFTLSLAPAAASPVGSVDDTSPTPGTTITYTGSVAHGNTITTLTSPDGDAISAEAGATTSSADFIIPAVTEFASGESMAATEWDASGTWLVGDGTSNASVTMEIDPPNADWFGQVCDPLADDGSNVFPNPPIEDATDDYYANFTSGISQEVLCNGSTSAASSSWGGIAYLYDDSASSWVDPVSFMVQPLGVVTYTRTQGLRHDSIVTALSALEAGPFNEDFIQLMKSDLSVSSGTFAELMIQWLQLKLSSSNTRLSGLKAEAAADRGVSRWQDITDVTDIGT